MRRACFSDLVKEVAKRTAPAQRLEHPHRPIFPARPGHELEQRHERQRTEQAANHDRSLRQRLAAIPGIGAIGARELTEPDGRELLPLIAASLNLIDSSDLPAAAKRELTALYTTGLIHDATHRHRELVVMLRLASTARQSG